MRVLFFAFDFQDIITGIAEEADYHPNLLCVALLQAVMEGPQQSSTVTFGDHALITSMDDLSTERTIFDSRAFGEIAAIQASSAPCCCMFSLESFIIETM